MTGWQEVRLGDIAIITAGGDAPKKAFSKTKTDEFTIPVYSNGISDKGLYGYTNKATIIKPATTISARGTIGAVFRRTEPYLPIVRLISVIGNEEIVDSDFLYYALCNQRIEGDGSVQAQLTVPMISDYCITIPPLQTQKRIARILSSLDDKIELNNQINRNLEEQIQALYKFYFEKNEKGTITHGKLKDICVYVTEKISVSELTLDNYFSTENLLSDKRGATKASGLPQTALTTKCVSGNILVSNIRPYFKKLLFCDKEGGCSTDVLCFQANTPQLTNFLYSTLYFDSFFDYMTAGSKGTKMPRGDKAQIMEYPIPIPAPDLLAEFNRQVGPMIKLCQKNKKENTILSQTRDTLLPKLISGEFA